MELSATYFTRKTVGLEAEALDSAEAVVCADAEAEKKPKKRQAKNTNAGSKTKLERILAPAAVLVAVVANGGAVGVPVDTAVLTVGTRLGVIVVGVAVDASKAGKIGRYLVAIVADRTMVGNREVRGVVEGSTEPAGGVVATRSVASGRESRRDVIGYAAAQGLCAVPIGKVTAVARRVGRGEAVIIADVALSTSGFGQMRAGESPTGGAVIERSRIPSRSVVASAA